MRISRENLLGTSEITMADNKRRIDIFSKHIKTKCIL